MIDGLRLRAVLLAVVLGAAGVAIALVPRDARADTPVLASRVIGHSVQGRPIVAYRLGDPDAKRTVLIVGQMHGDEHAGVTVANSIVDGTDSVEGVNLWVVPTMNPDGDAAATRQNAHGVDLNRNWPNNWAHLTGEYYSGPRPLSEPETRAMWHFLRRVRPSYVVSIHQPLDGVDKTAGTGRAYRAFRGELSRRLDLPVKDFQCWSVCHGSMSGWYQRKHIGVALETVEFGTSPTHDYLVGQARRGIVKALGGHFGSLARHDPRLKLVATPSGDRVVFSGWAYDPDKPGTRVRIRLTEDGSTLARHWARRPSPALDERRGLTGRHAYRFGIDASPGHHEFCLSARNLAAGGRSSRCTSVVVDASP